MWVARSIQEPIREGLTWDQEWKGEDKGLIKAWEVGRKQRESDAPEVAAAQRGELPVSVWKGGIEKKIKVKKYGSFWYLAQWQGWRGEDLDINTEVEVSLTCSRTGVAVIYTDDIKKYGNV